MLLTAHVLEHASRGIHFFLKSHKKRSPCQMNPAFCWLLSIYPSLLSPFKLQNYHAAQAEGGVQTLALLVPYYHAWSSCRHYKHVRWLRDVSPRAPLWQAASTRASFSLPFLFFLLPALMLLALSGAGREQEAQAAIVCGGTQARGICPGLF